jgi:pimeloyl-ACP methyl ester carboxylesterase
MATPRRRPIVALALLAAAVGACAATPLAPSSVTPAASLLSPSPTPSPPSPPSPSAHAISGAFNVDGGDVFLECRGAGAPTVIVETGLGGDSRPWAGVIDDLAPATRACRYDRAGIGRSEPRPGAADLSVGDRAEDLRALLRVAGVEGPYVLVGFSYGGMLIRGFADRYPTETAGLVFVDGSHEEQLVPGGWWMDHQPIWTDGAHTVDLVRSRSELLEAADLGARPTIVLTSGLANGELERRWTILQDKLAALSSASLHMIATEAGHDIRADRPELVVESIRAVIDAVRGTALPACGSRFETLGAECLAGTMADLLATWDARREEVFPAGGKLPRGRYSLQDDDATITLTLGDGRLESTVRHADGSVESFTAAYAAHGDEVTFVWPFDWRIPRTPGVNTARWTVDADGALRFDQIDRWSREPWLAVPWVPVPGA